jgi:hypothetical protein
LPTFSKPYVFLSRRCLAKHFHYRRFGVACIRSYTLHLKQQLKKDTSACVAIYPLHF